MVRSWGTLQGEAAPGTQQPPATAAGSGTARAPSWPAPGTARALCREHNCEGHLPEGTLGIHLPTSPGTLPAAHGEWGFAEPDPDIFYIALLPPPASTPYSNGSSAV